MSGWGKKDKPKKKKKRNVPDVEIHVPDPTHDERCCLPRLFWQALADPWHQQAREPGSARLQAPSVSPGDDPEPLALVRL